MKLIQKGNRQLRVDDVRAEELIKAGFVELDSATGKPVNVPDAKSDLQKENEALKAENEALKEQVAALTAAADEAKKPKK